MARHSFSGVYFQLCQEILAFVNLKNSHNLKVGDYVLIGGIFRTLSTGDSVSCNPEIALLKQGVGEGGGELEREVRGSWLYRSVQ